MAGKVRRYQNVSLGSMGTCTALTLPVLSSARGYLHLPISAARKGALISHSLVSRHPEFSIEKGNGGLSTMLCYSRNVAGS